VKKFLKEPDGYQLYKDVEIEWIKGRSPELFIYNKETNEQVEVVDLSSYKYQDLHDFFTHKFGKKSDVAHVDAIDINEPQIDEIAIENVKNANKQNNEEERIQMNAEIFDTLHKEESTSTQTLYMGILMVAVILVIAYVMTFNHSFIKRITNILGFNNGLHQK